MKSIDTKGTVMHKKVTIGVLWTLLCGVIFARETMSVVNEKGYSVEHDRINDTIKLTTWARQTRVPICDGVEMTPKKEVYFSQTEYIFPNIKVSTNGQSSIIGAEWPRSGNDPSVCLPGWVDDIRYPELPQMDKHQSTFSEQSIKIPSMVVNRVPLVIEKPKANIQFALQAHPAGTSPMRSHSARGPGAYCCVSLGYAPYSSKTVAQMEQEYIAERQYRCYCLFWYNMTPIEKYHFLRSYYSTFVFELLRRDLTDRAIWELWAEYKAKRWKNWNNEKAVYEKTIRDTLDQRNKQKQDQIERELRALEQKEFEKGLLGIAQKKQEEAAAEQKRQQKELEKAAAEMAAKKEEQEQKEREQKRIEEERVAHEQNVVVAAAQRHYIINQHDQLAALLDYDDENDELAQSLQATQATHYLQVLQQHVLSADAEGLLRLLNLYDPAQQELLGTPLQHYLQGDIHELLNQAALYYDDSLYQHESVKDIAFCAVAATEANRLNSVVVTHTMTQIGWDMVAIQNLIVETCNAFMQGVTTSLQDSLNDPVKKISHVLCSTIMVTALVATLPETTTALAFVGTCTTLHRIMQGQLDSSSWSERCHALGEFCTDYVVNQKIMTGIVASCHYLQNCIPSASKAVRCATGGDARLIDRYMCDLEQMLDEQGNMIWHVVKSEPQKLPALQKQLQSRPSQRALPVLPAVSMYKSPDTFITQLQKIGYKVSVKRPDMRKDLEFFVAQANQMCRVPLDQSLVDYCKNIPIVINNQPLKLDINIEHIMNPDYKVLLDKSYTYYQTELSGGHLAGVVEKLEQLGYLEVDVSRIKNVDGCIERSVKDRLSGKTITKTSLPPEVTPQMIVQEIESAVKTLAAQRADLTKGWAKEISLDKCELKVVVEPIKDEITEKLIGLFVKTAYLKLKP